MDNFSDKTTKYISENPKFIAIIIIAMIAIIIWLYLKSTGFMSKFMTNSKTKKSILKEKNNKVDTEEDETEEVSKVNKPIKKTSDKKQSDSAIAQLVKDINNNV